MVHRAPGDSNSLSAVEKRFGAVAEGWVGEETAAGAAQAVPDEQSSFTRVVIGDLKREVLQQVVEDEGGGGICR